jgi:hypothetical protein
MLPQECVPINRSIDLDYVVLCVASNFSRPAHISLELLPIQLLFGMKENNNNNFEIAKSKEKTHPYSIKCRLSGKRIPPFSA